MEEQISSPTPVLERVIVAMDYINGGISQREACRRAKLCDSTLRRYLYSQTDPNTPIVEKKRGRQPIITPAGKEKLQTEVINRTLSLQSMTAGEFNKLFKEIAKSERPNQVAEVEYSSRTLRKYMKELNLVTGIAESRKNLRIGEELNSQNLADNENPTKKKEKLQLNVLILRVCQNNLIQKVIGKDVP